MTAEVERVRAADGTTLHLHRWTPDGAPRGATLIVHGLGEHGGRHAVTGEALAAAGILAETYDQRGFGRSEGRRAWVADWGVVHADLEERLVALRARVSGLPVALLGHSLGGLIVLGFVLDEAAEGGVPGTGAMPDLMVLSAPAIADRLPRWKHSLAGPLGRLVPGIRISNGVTRGMLASRPIATFDYGERDEAVVTSSTARFGAAALAEQRRVRELVDSVDRLPVPTLVVHGGADPLVPTESSERFERFAEVTRIVYPGFRHEHHHELESTSAADIAAWLRARMAG